jgi:hypothetical protein
MPDFKFRAEDAAGTKYHNVVSAGSLPEARGILEHRGYRRIEFFDDEHAGDIQRSIQASEEIPAWAKDEPVDVEEELAANARQGVARKLWWAFKGHLIFIAPLAIWNVVSWRGERPFGWGDWLGFVLTPLYALFFCYCVAPMVLFELLLEACVWHDWAAARRRIRLARALRRVMRAGIPELELQIRDAYALAGQGRVAEGLAAFERLRGQPGMGDGMYFSRLSSVYEYAHDIPGMIRCLEQAAALSTGASEWIDVATARIRHARDVAGAKAALEKTTGKEIPVLAAAGLDRCRGMIAVEEGDHRAACALLVRALGPLQEHAGNPLIQSWIAETRAYLAIAQAGAGERDAALAHLRAIEHFLATTKEDALLARCRTAVGVFR